MGITENAAYLKGLFDGYEIDVETKEGKIISKLCDLVAELAEKVASLEVDNRELAEYVYEIDEDLTDLENDIYDVDEDDEEYEDYSDLNEDDEYSLDDEAYYEIECPSCSEKICFTDDIDIETLVCPACGEVVGDVEIVTEEE